MAEGAELLGGGPLLVSFSGTFPEAGNCRPDASPYHSMGIWEFQVEDDLGHLSLLSWSDFRHRLTEGLYGMQSVRESFWRLDDNTHSNESNVTRGAGRGEDNDLQIQFQVSFRFGFQSAFCWNDLSRYR